MAIDLEFRSLRVAAQWARNEWLEFYGKTAHQLGIKKRAWWQEPDAEVWCSYFRDVERVKVVPSDSGYDLQFPYSSDPTYQVPYHQNEMTLHKTEIEAWIYLYPSLKMDFDRAKAALHFAQKRIAELEASNKEQERVAPDSAGSQ